MKFEFTCTEVVEITLKKEAFTEKFISEFNETFFVCNTLQEHAEHIAQMASRNVFTVFNFDKEFVEGYGLLGNFVEAITVGYTETEKVI